MEFTRVEGEDLGDIKLFALSTCGWCGKVKQLLNDLGAAYGYIDVDKLQGDEREAVRQEVINWNSRCSFPTTVVREETCIVGFKEDELKEALGK